MPLRYHFCYNAPEESGRPMDLAATAPHAPASGTPLGALIATLSGSILTHEVAGLTARRAESVCIYDSTEGMGIARDAIVLGVGVKDPAALVPVLAEQGACALVVATSCDISSETASLCEAYDLGLLRLSPGVGWLEAAAMVDAGLGRARPTAGPAGEFSGIPDGDLFALAGVIGRLVDAPVTIEDRNTHVLAFSERQEEADFVRINSILQRTRPPDYHETSMDAVLQSDQPVFLPSTVMADGRVVMPRLAVAIRDGGQLMGTIWAVVTDPPDAEHEHHMLAASYAAAWHLRCHEQQSDSARAENLATAILEGRHDVPQAAALLGIHGPAAVIAVALADLDRPAPMSELSGFLHRVAWRDRISSALALHLHGLTSTCVTTSIGDLVYAVVSLDDRDLSEFTDACRTFAENAGRQPRLYIGLGRVAPTMADLTRSRADAELAVRTLRETPARGQVVQLSDVLVESLLLDLNVAAERESRGPSGAFARLLDYDAARGANLVETLAAWLDTLGDVSAASATCGVHPNTFRYRLTRISEVGQVDLSDPEQRFALDFQLHLFGDRTVA